MSRLHTPLLLAVLLYLPFLFAPASAAIRPDAGQSKTVPHPGASVVSVQPADLNQILQCLLGPNVEVSNAVLTGAAGATGLFTGGSTVFGIGEGVVLSSGNVSSIVGPNLLDDTSTDNL